MILFASAWVCTDGVSSIITITHLEWCLRFGGSCTVGMCVAIFLPIAAFTKVHFWDEFVSATGSFMVVASWGFSLGVAKFHDLTHDLLWTYRVM